MQHIDLQNNFHVLMEAAVSKQQPKKRLITMSQETIKNLLLVVNVGMCIVRVLSNFTRNIAE